jgi:hypothetical protein
MVFEEGGRDACAPCCLHGLVKGGVARVSFWWGDLCGLLNGKDGLNADVWTEESLNVAVGLVTELEEPWPHAREIVPVLQPPAQRS